MFRIIQNEHNNAHFTEHIIQNEHNNSHFTERFVLYSMNIIMHIL